MQRQHKKAGVIHYYLAISIYYVIYSDMTIDIATLPDDQLQLKQMLVDFQARFDKETGILLEQIGLLRSQLYGPYRMRPEDICRP